MDLHGHFCAAHVGEEVGAGFDEGSRDIAHGDRMSGRRAKAARGDRADAIALGVEQRRAAAHRLASERFQADALFGLFWVDLSRPMMVCCRCSKVCVLLMWRSLCWMAATVFATVSAGLAAVIALREQYEQTADHHALDTLQKPD